MQNLTLRILHAEDNAGIAKAIASLLRSHAPVCELDIDLVWVDSFAEFERRAVEKWDAILLDLTFPDAHRDITFRWIEANSTKCAAIIVVTASERNEDLEQAFDVGALRFVLKQDMLKKPRHLLLEIYESVLIRAAILKRYAPKT